MTESTGLYISGEYLSDNPSWHIEDSDWKSQQVSKLIKQNELKISSLCDFGCGAGEVLLQIGQKNPQIKELHGYDLANLTEMWEPRASERVQFFDEDFFESDRNYDLLIALDVLEHVENYYQMLRRLKSRSKYFVFAFPLEIFAIKALLGHRFLDSRTQYGHLHYFNKATATTVLAEQGFEIVDYEMASRSDGLKGSKSLNRQTALLNLPRKITAKFSEDLASNLWGGYSLYVLAK